MKKTAILATLALAAALVLGSCSGSKSSDSAPMKMAKEMNGYLTKGEYEKAVKYWFDNMAVGEKEAAAEQKKEMEQYVSTFAEKIKTEYDQKGGVKEIAILSETISPDGLNADIVLETTYGDGTKDTETSSFIKENGEWKFKALGDK